MQFSVIDNDDDDDDDDDDHGVEEEESDFILRDFKHLRWLNTVSDACTAFAIFQKPLIPGLPNFARHQLKG